MLFKRGYRSGLKEKIEQLYHEIQIKEKLTNGHCISDEQFNEYKKLESHYTQIAPDLSCAIAKRLKAHAEIKNGKGYVSTQSYQLSNNAVSLLKSNGYLAQDFTHYSGNQLQHVIHQESIALLEKTNALPYGSIIYPYQNALVNCAVSVSDYNKKGRLYA